MRVFLFLISLIVSTTVNAEVSFSHSKMKIGQQIIDVEIAQTDAQQRQGLMFRKELKDSAGMLFTYPEERDLGFWMKNTFIPLSIGFFDKNKKLVQVLDMEPTKSEIQFNFPVYESRVPVQYALEVNKGWFKKHNIPLGATFEILPDKSPAR